ncbi:recombinase family protein [Lysobacter sp. M2-1]|uniref:recombinase family protein n=1 Tax=Lysobacter sp. M2-1 TaxID=2916839 RepID=UPI001F57F691|nr:recombinase family protein [Lysobacter sp. M2-1]
MKVCRVYLRVSADDQDLARQESIIANAKVQGWYVAGVYREKASGARADRPELLRMVGDLQPGEAVIAERIDRLTRLPLEEAERLVQAIKDKGARLVIPGVVDLSEVVEGASGVAAVVLKSVQEMLLRVALQGARDDYEERHRRQAEGIALAKAAGKYRGRPADPQLHTRIRSMRQAGMSIAETAKAAGCSLATVKRAGK